jgi:hypothetical protein
MNNKRTDETSDTGDKWVFDKKIPISLIVVLALQTGSFVWWAATAESRIVDHERRILVAESYDRESMRSNMDVCQRMARVEEKVNTAIMSINRVESAIKDLHGRK